MNQEETDLWREQSCDHCGHTPHNTMPEGQVATVSVTVAPTDKPEHWRLHVESPARGAMIVTTVRGGSWERALAGGLRSAEVYINALLCEYKDRPLDQLRFERTHEALRELAIVQASAVMPGNQTPGHCKTCGEGWEYGKDEKHGRSCPAQSLALDDPLHRCDVEGYRYCHCGKFNDPQKD